VQEEIFKRLGRDGYIKLPKPGTNPRGVEISKEALICMCNHPDTKRIALEWARMKVEKNPYKHWIDLWKED